MSGNGSTITYFPMESVKIIAESVGIPNLNDEVAKELSDDVTFRIKSLVQDCSKFMIHGKRKKLCFTDVDNSLQMKNIEPLYGILSKEYIPFRFTSGGGRELHFIEDKELEVSELVSSPVPKFPLQTVIKTHWLAIDGTQPSIPENPPPIDKDDQKKDAVDPAVKLSFQRDKKDEKHIHGRGMKSIETVKVKQLATHELSAEQQLYYKEITEACVGSDEPKRGEALQSLAFDPGLFQMVPRLCTFIAEGVRVNVVQKNLALLIYLMRMAKALLDNQSLYLEKYLHELVPPIMTCIVSRQLCLKPELDNHWALRDFAARLISFICKNYNTSTNGLQVRITRLFVQCLTFEGTPSLSSSMYGAIAGLSELGLEVLKVFLVPKLKALSDEIERCNEGSSAFERNAASHIKTLLIKTVTPVLKVARSPPDDVNEYRDDFGFFLGPQLQVAVAKARQGGGGAPANTASSTAAIKMLAPTTRIVQHGGVLGQRTFVVNKQSSSASQLGSSKVIIMSSKPSAITTPMDTEVDESSLQLQRKKKFVLVSGPNQTTIKQEIKEEPMDVLSPQPDLEDLTHD